MPPWRLRQRAREPSARRARPRRTRSSPRPTWASSGPRARQGQRSSASRRAGTCAAWPPSIRRPKTSRRFVTPGRNDPSAGLRGRVCRGYRGVLRGGALGTAAAIQGMPAKIVQIVLTPGSGDGRARATARRLQKALGRRGYKLRIQTFTDLESLLEWSEACAPDFDYLVAIGGDATISGAAGASVRLSIPFVPVPNGFGNMRSEEHTSELQSRENLVCRLL